MRFFPQLRHCNTFPAPPHHQTTTYQQFSPRNTPSRRYPQGTKDAKIVRCMCLETDTKHIAHTAYTRGTCTRLNLIHERVTPQTFTAKQTTHEHLTHSHTTTLLNNYAQLFLGNLYLPRIFVTEKLD